MSKLEVLHSPTLESVLMVEKAVKDNSGGGKYQIWKKLPRKMMYQTYLHILSYLEASSKILIAKDGAVIWIWNPGRVRRLLKEGLVVK